MYANKYMHAKIFMIEFDNLENMMRKIEIELSLNGIRPDILYDKCEEFFTAYDQTSVKLIEYIEESKSEVETILSRLTTNTEEGLDFIKIPLTVRILQERYLDINNKNNFLSTKIKETLTHSLSAEAGI